MRFQCLCCGKPFGWTAKKTVSKMIEGFDLPVTMEYIVCPYCEGFDFEEVNGVLQKKKKETPPIQLPTPATKSLPEFDPAILMNHSWKNKRIKGTQPPQYEKGSVNWGWDFKDQFVAAALDLLEKGPITIGENVFELDGKIVNARKVSA